jgi:ADP-ribosylglycohydrolase
MVMGAFMGDALALGAHWVYNTNVIDKKFGTPDRYRPPLTSYHTGKQAGDFTHYGDQMVVLLESMAETGGFEAGHFAGRWRAFFQSYEGYFDKATKSTLQNMEERQALLGCGSPSDDLAGASRIAPIVFAYAEDAQRLDAAVSQQTAVTHDNEQVIECARFFGRVVVAVLRGEAPGAAIETALASGELSDPSADLVRRGMKSRGDDSRGAIARFGQMCSVEAALPGTIHLICTYETDFSRALIENVRAGGDSAARGMLLGMVLGAHAGTEALPSRWLDELNRRPRIEACLDRLNRSVE